ncbi:MAG: DUF3011 domain-containing protein [Rudaea sp.]
MSTRVFIFGIAFAAAALAPVVAAHADSRRGDQRTVDCSSHDYERQRCNVPWRDARLVEQLSDTPCVRDQNWGVDRRGLWVDQGCAGRFVDSRGGRGHGRDDEYGNENAGEGWRPDPSWNRRFSVTCESQGNASHFCQVDLGRGGHASLQRQLSNTRCIENRNWGSNRAGVWVSQGCRAIFSIDRQWR